MEDNPNGIKEVSSLYTVTNKKVHLISIRSSSRNGLNGGAM